LPSDRIQRRRTMSSSKPHADFAQERGRRSAQDRSNYNYAPDSLLAHLRRGELHRQALANEDGATQQRPPALIHDPPGSILSTTGRGRSLENLREILEHASEILEEASAVVASVAAERSPSGSRPEPSASPVRRKRPHPLRRRHSYPPSQ
jgi:hypothetical protein